eukprot:5938924-Amphidinium_carterae.2
MMRCMPPRSRDAWCGARWQAKPAIPSKCNCRREHRVLQQFLTTSTAPDEVGSLSHWQSALNASSLCCGDGCRELGAGDGCRDAAWINGSSDLPLFTGGDAAALPEGDAFGNEARQPQTKQ